MKNTTLDPEGGGLVADLVYGIVSKEDIEYIGGLASGAIPIIASVCARSWQGRPIRGFYVRDEMKTHGMMKLIEGFIEDGSNVIILDDVTTAGESVMKAVEEVRARHCNVVKVVSIVDRSEGARDRFRREGLEFVSVQEVEAVTATAETESPASTEHLMEAICAPDNIGAALRAVVRAR
jgi:orotate phosphoribosyltransferase